MDCLGCESGMRILASGYGQRFLVGGITEKDYVAGDIVCIFSMLFNGSRLVKLTIKQLSAAMATAPKLGLYTFQGDPILENYFADPVTTTAITTDTDVLKLNSALAPSDADITVFSSGRVVSAITSDAGYTGPVLSNIGERDRYSICMKLGANMAKGTKIIFDIEQVDGL